MSVPWLLLGPSHEVMDGLSRLFPCDVVPGSTEFSKNSATTKKIQKAVTICHHNIFATIFVHITLSLCKYNTNNDETESSESHHGSAPLFPSLWDETRRLGRGALAPQVVLGSFEAWSMLDVDGLSSGEFNEDFEMACAKCILNDSKYDFCGDNIFQSAWAKHFIVRFAGAHCGNHAASYASNKQNLRHPFCPLALILALSWRSVLANPDWCNLTRELGSPHPTLINSTPPRSDNARSSLDAVPPHNTFGAFVTQLNNCECEQMRLSWYFTVLRDVQGSNVKCFHENSI